MTEELKSRLISEAANAAVKAGAEIMKIYKHSDDYAIDIKSDSSPITVADRAAHNKIKEALAMTYIPILSEEGREMIYDERRNWEMFWLVDPLDGTLEFIKGNNEFTVNIALMHENRCIASVVYVPYYRKMYIGVRGGGSYFIDNVTPDENADYGYEELRSRWSPLPLQNEPQHDRPRVAVSRSHCTPETMQRVDEIRQRHPDIEVVEQGSSYKFCMLAEGTVDYYVRTSTTYEWDTAAGELILAEAGGSTSVLDRGGEFGYNKEDLRNPWFECRSCRCRI
ncbi:MAG: 3'(2'),5'-bisphosphate nucleotidase CysQ [Alistipes sp.]|nr:3'(2'),5'-bisphosphate nucleotidase CysQ [Alistipes sp.]